MTCRPSWPTRVRVYSTGHGTKTDNTDALAIARAALHSRHLRIVKPDDETVAIKLLSDRRKELVGLRTQAVCRLHRLFRELIPGGGPALITANKPKTKPGPRWPSKRGDLQQYRSPDTLRMNGRPQPFKPAAV